MTNQEMFVQTFGKDAWLQMISFTGMADRFKDFWTSPYKEDRDCDKENEE